MIGEERDTRIPYRLGTDEFCKFKGRDEYVRMGDLVVCPNEKTGDHCQYPGRLGGVMYDRDGFIFKVILYTLDWSFGFDLANRGVFYHATEVKDD